MGANHQDIAHLKTKNMKSALFTNFTTEEFVGAWDGKVKRFAPGQSLYMPDGLAKHFAKHLANRELLRKNANGDLVIKDGDKFTSPKFPEQVPQFMELFNKAYTPDNEEELGSQKDDMDALIDAANKNRSKAEAPKESPAQGVQIAEFPEDDDEEFEGKPVEAKAPANQN